MAYPLQAIYKRWNRLPQHKYRTMQATRYIINNGIRVVLKVNVLRSLPFAIILEMKTYLVSRMKDSLNCLTLHTCPGKLRTILKKIFAPFIPSLDGFIDDDYLWKIIQDQNFPNRYSRSRVLARLTNSKQLPLNCLQYWK